jgi:hypothetical protein
MADKNWQASGKMMIPMSAHDFPKFAKGGC